MQQTVQHVFIKEMLKNSNQQQQFMLSNSTSIYHCVAQGGYGLLGDPALALNFGLSCVNGGGTAAIKEKEIELNKGKSDCQCPMLSLLLSESQNALKLFLLGGAKR